MAVKPRVDAGVKELNEMTIGRTDDPENPFVAQAFKAASMFGLGSRTPSGPAAVPPRQQAGHMIAIDPPVRILIFSLASEGPSTHATRCADAVRLADYRPRDGRWCTCRKAGDVAPVLSRYAMTRRGRTEFRRPAASIRLRALVQIR